MRITETARIIISMGEKIDRLEEENEQLKAIIALYGITDIVKDQRQELKDLGVIRDTNEFEFSPEDREKLRDAFSIALDKLEANAAAKAARIKEIAAKYPITAPDYDLQINVETGEVKRVNQQ